MAWTYYAYLFSNIGIGAAILVIIGGFLIVLIYKYDSIFYKIIKLMFHIELKYPNEKCNEDRKKKDASVQKTDKTTDVVIVKEAFIHPQQLHATISATKAVNDEMYQTPSNEKHLNLYGKVIDGQKKRHKIMLGVIIVAVVGAVSVAGVQGCLLANITVYPNGPCPSYGIMDCYGKNGTYFNCTPSTQTDSTLFTDSATCFRWIARDTTINDIMTQLGVCTGLFHAFCAIVQLMLRFLVYIWSKKKQTLSEPKEQTAGTVATDRSANTAEDNHDIDKPKCTYESPVLATLSCLILISIPFGAIVCAVLLGMFRISITALTYLVLVTIVIVSCFAILWIMIEEGEDDDDTRTNKTFSDATIMFIDNEETVPKQDATENNEKRPQRGGFQPTVSKVIKVSDLSPISDVLLRQTS